MPTTTNGIYYPSLVDAIDAIQGDFATLASSVDTALFSNKVPVHFVATTAARNSLATSYAPTADKPLIVWRKDAEGNKYIEVTVNGSTWDSYGQLGRGGVPFRMAQVSVNVTIGAGSNVGTATATFPAGRFTVAPGVQVSPNSSGNPVASYSNVTASGCTVTVTRPYNASTASAWTLNVTVTATQMLSGAAAG